MCSRTRCVFRRTPHTARPPRIKAHIPGPSRQLRRGRRRALSGEEGRSLSAGGTVAEAARTPLSAGEKTQIPSVDWWTTSHCNLSCDFCYGPVPGKDPVDRRDGILEALAASSARAVTFCGGEPLLLRRIGEHAAALRQRGKSTVLNTNGELLRRRLDQGLRLADFALVGIS